MIWVFVSLFVIALIGCLMLWARTEALKEAINQAYFETFSGGSPREMFDAYNALWSAAGLEEKGPPRGNIHRPPGGGPKEPDDAVS